MLLDRYYEYSPLAVRLFSISSASVYALGGLGNVLMRTTYTTGVVGLYALVFGSITLLCEFSPLGFNSLREISPFFEEYRYRGCLYVWFGILTMGDEMGILARAGGTFLLFAGLACILLHYIGAVGPMGTAGGLDPDANNWQERVTDGSEQDYPSDKPD